MGRWVEVLSGVPGVGWGLTSCRGGGGGVEICHTVGHAHSRIQRVVCSEKVTERGPAVEIRTSKEMRARIERDGRSSMTTGSDGRLEGYEMSAMTGEMSDEKKVRSGEVSSEVQEELKRTSEEMIEDMRQGKAGQGP
eukprot:767051-Hanusia_phi.AAC.9